MVSYPARDLGSKRWYEFKGDELGKMVYTLGSSLEGEQRHRMNKARTYLSLYEGVNSQGVRGLLTSAQTLEAESSMELQINVTKSAVDTVISEIAGRQKPMAKFQTSDADWKTKRKAKKLEKFVLGVMAQPQQDYLDAWEVMQSAFLDALVWGDGLVKVFYSDGKICLERHFAHELYIDPAEGIYGDPQNLFQVRTMELDRAIFEFAEDPSLGYSSQKKKQIRSMLEGSGEVDPDTHTSSPRIATVIKIVEAWHLKQSEKIPGKHAFACNKGLLFEEDYDRDAFPFVHLRWHRNRMGYWSQGLVEVGEPIQREININAVRLQERFRLCASKRTYIPEGAVAMEAMQANDAEVLVEFTGDQPPIETTPKIISEAEFSWYNDQFEKYYELTGVSQMRATARKEPGVTAGVAIRTMNDMQTARFALPGRAYENGFVQLAKQILVCAREVAEFEGGMTVRYDEEINWKDCDVPENTFDISIAPASSLPNDPAGRMQFVQELYSAGVIGVETFKELLGWPDLEREMNNQTAQNRYIEKKVDEMLDAAEGSYEERAPDPLLMDKPGALMRVAQSYFDAMYDGAPEYNLQLLRDYIAGINELIAPPQPPMPGPEMMGADPSMDPAAGGGAPPMPAGPPAGMPPEAMRPPVA